MRQEHGSFLGDIHLHPWAHLLSASRCQDNLPAEPRRRQGGGRRWLWLLLLVLQRWRAEACGGPRCWGVGASGARAPTQPGHSPLPLPQGSGIGSWGGLRRTLTQAQRASLPWRRRQSGAGQQPPFRKLSVELGESDRYEGGIGYTEGLEVASSQNERVWARLGRRVAVGPEPDPI